MENSYKVLFRTLAGMIKLQHPTLGIYYLPGKIAIDLGNYQILTSFTGLNYGSTNNFESEDTKKKFLITYSVKVISTGNELDSGNINTFSFDSIVYVDDELSSAFSRSTPELGWYKVIDGKFKKICDLDDYQSLFNEFSHSLEEYSSILTFYGKKNNDMMKQDRRNR